LRRRDNFLDVDAEKLGLQLDHALLGLEGRALLGYKIHWELLGGERSGILDLVTFEMVEGDLRMGGRRVKRKGHERNDTDT